MVLYDKIYYILKIPKVKKLEFKKATFLKVSFY